MSGTERLVYVIDDNDRVRATIEAMVDACGFQPVALAPGELAHRLRMRLPRAIVSDILMPGQDGFEVMDLLAEEAPQTPLLLVSGYGHRFLSLARRRAQASGLAFCETRDKPLRLDDLRGFLRDADARGGRC